MITGIGIDLVEIPRIKAITEEWGQRFLSIVFTPEELNFCNKRNNRFHALAAKFAAKEALLKAIGTGFSGGADWKDIEIVEDERSQPYFRITGKIQEWVGEKIIILSLTYTDELAAATVILEEKVKKTGEGSCKVKEAYDDDL